MIEIIIYDLFILINYIMYLSYNIKLFFKTILCPQIASLSFNFIKHLFNILTTIFST